MTPNTIATYGCLVILGFEFEKIGRRAYYNAGINKRLTATNIFAAEYVHQKMLASDRIVPK